MKNSELGKIIKLINNDINSKPSEMNIEITILVDGKFISGTIISYKEYMELFTSNTGKNLINVLYKPLLDNYIEGIKNNDIENLDKINDYIHLKNVKIASGDINLDNYPYGLKIKLDNISAFMYGTTKE